MVKNTAKCLNSVWRCSKGKPKFHDTFSLRIKQQYYFKIKYKVETKYLPNRLKFIKNNNYASMSTTVFAL